VLNPFTRLAVEMCPATGVLRAAGYEMSADQELPKPATLPTEVTASMAAV
jgi:predicted DNA-binding transcriptional regulator AlpA